MAGVLIKDYIGAGLIANRPTTPSVVTPASATYYATDTSTLYVWDNIANAWDTVTGGGGGGGTVGAKRYWRFVSLGKIPGTYTGFSGMELHATTGGANVATGGTALSYVDVQASSGNIWGGNGTSDFFQFNDTNGVVSWVGYDLGSGNSTVVQEFTMYPAIGSVDRAPNSFAIECSTDGIAWMRVASYSVGPTVWVANTKKTFAVPLTVF